MKQESWGRRIWRLIYPGLLYYGICFVVQFVSVAVISFQTMMGYEASELESKMTDIMTDVMTKTLSVALDIQVLGAILTIPFLLLFYRKDRIRDRLAGRETKVVFRPPVFSYLLIPILGAALCLAGNNLILISGLYTVSEEYETVANLLYGGKLVLEVVGVGVIVPIAEELIFRGLVYRRLREYSQVGWAAFISALIFGIYHGNLVQGVYAFCLGLLLVYVYERYHSMLAPILLHAAANILSVAGSELDFLDRIYKSAAAFWILTILCCALIILMVWLMERHAVSLVEEKKENQEEEHSNHPWDNPL